MSWLTKFFFPNKQSYQTDLDPNTVTKRPEKADKGLRVSVDDQREKISSQVPSSGQFNPRILFTFFAKIPSIIRGIIEKVGQVFRNYAPWGGVVSQNKSSSQNVKNRENIDRVPDPIGLPNETKTTCYMNAPLQAYFASDVFLNHLDDLVDNDDRVDSNDPSSEVVVLLALKELADVTRTKDDKAIEKAIDNFHKVLFEEAQTLGFADLSQPLDENKVRTLRGSHPKQMELESQLMEKMNAEFIKRMDDREQDFGADLEDISQEEKALMWKGSKDDISQEVWKEIEAAGKVRKNEMIANLPKLSEAKQKACEEKVRRMMQRDAAPVAELLTNLLGFFIKAKRITQGIQGEERTSIDETLGVLQVPIRGDGGDLQELVNNLHREVIDGQWRKFSRYERLLEIPKEQLPSVMTLQLKCMNDYGEKIQAPVALPKDGIIDMKELVGEEVKYRIVGVVKHKGKQLNGGHYTADVIKGEKTFHCDDEKIREGASNQNAGQSYLVVLEKIEE